MDQELAATKLSDISRIESTEYQKIPEARSSQRATLSSDLVVGATVENCVLVAELGCGASGRVFLAQQLLLADRPVVLKITTAHFHEEENLARLQHTNIMPLYWAATMADRERHVLAMPYMGCTTLAGLLKHMDAFPRETWDGRRVFEVLQQDQAELPIRIPVPPHAADHLKQASWVTFVVRLGHTLAKALAYAHERGLLHLDLKPANILICPDGQPILLDLDVARQPISAGSTSVAWLGGTLSYMSPEQHAAIEALKLQQPIPCAVDGRSDQYSLGLILYHALGGASDSQGPPDPRGLPRANPQVSQGLADLVARCLAVNPGERYADANALADDLDRHLQDLPLRGVRNGLAERWRKWRRRRPLGLPLLVLMACFCVTAGAAGFNYQQLNEERRRQAEAALAEGQEWQRQGQHQAAVLRFRAGRELAEHSFGTDSLKAQLERRLRQAQRLHKADELNEVVHLMRFYALQEHTPRRMQHVLEAAGRKLWSERELLTDPAAGKLELAAEKNIRAQLQELVLLWSELQVQLAPPTHVEPVRDDVRKVLTEAERMFGPSLGLSLAEERTGLPHPLRQPQAAWEFCALGRLALARGEHDTAARSMQQALDLEPLGFVPHFYSGVCALRQQRYADALQTFSFCVGRNPCAECFLLRGKAHAALGNSESALKDFNRALEKNPELGIAYQHRGALYREMGQVEDAEKNFKRARELRD